MNNREMRDCRSFTLIEMMVVIVVILILAGIVLRTTVLVIRNSGKAKAIYEIEQIQNALNEYFAEYGSYPPVYGDPAQNMQYEYEGGHTRDNPYFKNILTDDRYNNHDDPSPPFFADMYRPGGYPASQPDVNLFYRYGLVSYLYKRSDGHYLDPHWYDMDTARDIAAKKRWEHFLEKVDVDSGRGAHTISLQGTQITFTNAVSTLLDPWGNDYRYDSFPPHMSYRLWSAGPDETDGTPDDINASSDGQRK